MTSIWKGTVPLSSDFISSSLLRGVHQICNAKRLNQVCSDCQGNRANATDQVRSEYSDLKVLPYRNRAGMNYKYGPVMVFHCLTRGTFMALWLAWKPSVHANHPCNPSSETSYVIGLLFSSHVRGHRNGSSKMQWQAAVVSVGLACRSQKGSVKTRAVALVVIKS